MVTGVVGAFIVTAVGNVEVVNKSNHVYVLNLLHPMVVYSV